MNAKPVSIDTKQSFKNISDLQAALASANKSTSAKDRINATQAVIEVLTRMGVIGGKHTPATTEPAIIDDNMPASDMLDRTGMEELASTSKRQKANDKAVALLATIKEQGLTRDDLSAEQLADLAAYTGAGGGLTSSDGETRGSAYEYYTPKVIASTLWDLASELGFTGGKVLDPSAGTGIFAATSPDNVVIDSIELDETSGAIASILNDGHRSKTVVSPFEKRVGLIEDDSLDMVITNVPFGANATRGANKNHDEAYQKETLENYFILRSLEKVKHGGLAIFITPTSVISGRMADKERLRKLTSLKAELLGAYRLPNVVFKQTGADVMTDIVVYRKHSAEARDQINALYEAGEIEKLTSTKVLWDEYISGKYFKDKKRAAKFVLGESRLVPSRYNPEKMVEEVFSTKKTPEIAKMIKKFGGSRIDWDALGAAEADYIEYKNGDTLFQDGKQLEYQDGKWIVMAKEATDTDTQMQTYLASMGSAIEMVVAGITYEQAEAVSDYARQTSQADLIPQAARSLFNRCMSAAPAKRFAAWPCVIAAQAIRDVIADQDYGYNFMSNEPALTKFMKTAYLDGKNAGLIQEPKQDLNFVKLYYANGKYNAVWRGQVDTEIEAKDEAKSYTSLIARMQYDNKSLFLSREQLAAVNPDTDPLTDNEWFINHDGSQVIAANDFLTGSLANCLTKIDAEIKQATDPKIIAKLEQQKIFATERVSRIDLQKVDFDLRSPLIGAEDKVRFLKQIGFKDAYVSFDEYGKGTPDIHIKGAEYDKEKLSNRIGDWMAKGTVTTGGVTLSDMTEREALDWLSDQINTANVKFSNWVKANDNLIKSLELKMNSNDNLFFSQNSDETPVEIAGMNPLLNLHGYQNAFVRNQGRHFGGINGMGVGLGKTFSSLASVQHTQNIGAKKKTIFVVPNSVLSNWRKEAAFAFVNTDDCIFVGLREKGDKFRVYSNKYDEDLLTAIDSKYRKIFMTFEAFKRIRLKDATIEKYAGYVKDNDSAYENKELHKDNEKTEGMVADLIQSLTMKSNAPFLEDMRIDSVVIDEAHAFKNSISAPNTGDRIKYLSQPTESARGEDAQAKLWYIRGLTAANDGVQLLTATPITNSPLEIYSMLSLAGGRDTVNKMCGGIKGADEFISVMCQIEEEVVPTIDGKTRSQNVFTGIKNAQILKKAVRANAVIKDAQDVGMSVVIPDREELSTVVNLGAAVNADLTMLQEAYTVARAIEKDPDNHPYKSAEDPMSPNNPNSPYSIIARRYGETNDLMAHPFNLIRKLDVMIADSEFSDMVTFYDFDQEQLATAEKVVNQFNNGKKKHVDERKRKSPYTEDENAKQITKKEDGETILVGYKITCKASIILDGGRQRIIIDTLNSKFQTSFEDMAEKAKLSLDVTISPKLAAMLDNFKNEQANPRGINNDGTSSKIVKQIIFCDHLFLHNKIKKILAKRAGVPASKIAIITGQTNNEPDQMIDIQDGFNAAGADNQYQVIIANKKAEVGINLQRGTQAIHHLTTGWTPDSLEQRNGRGARQGNMTERVKIFHYDADGTFDEFKRTMIDKKDEWISGVLSDEDVSTIEVSGSITRAEQDALIRMGGDSEAMREYQAKRDAAETQARKDLAMNRYKINIEVVKEQTQIAKKLSIRDFYEGAVNEIVNLVRDNHEVYKKIHADKSSANVRATSTKRYAATKSVIIDKLKDLISNMSLQQMDDRWRENIGEPVQSVVEPEDAYNVIKANVTGTSMFAASKDNMWAIDFGRDILTRGLERGNYSPVVNKDGMLQASYDDVYSTSRNLIQQALLAANELAERSGMAGMVLPDDAGVMIADGKAVIENGVYYTVGTIAVRKSKDQDPDQLYAITISNYGTISGKSLMRVTDFRGDIFYRQGHLSPSELKADLVIQPNDPQYIKYLKDMAKTEDEALAAGAIQSDDDATYSKNIPQVAEYRDGSVKPVWTMRPNLQGRHDGLSGCMIPIMLPYGVLEAGTPFATYMLDKYKDEGVIIDVEARTYQINNSNIEVSKRQYNTSLTDDTYILYLASIIKISRVKLTDDDWMLTNRAEVVAELSQPPTDELIRAVSAAAETITERKTKFELEDMAGVLFDKYLYNDKRMSNNIEIETKIAALEYVYDELTGKSNTFDVIEFLQKQGALNAAKVQAEAAGAKIDDSGLKHDDVVVIGGYTKTWYKKIKEYADMYGSPVDGGQHAKYDPKRKFWMVTYSSFTALVKDHPTAAVDLTFEKRR